MFKYPIQIRIFQRYGHDPETSKFIAIYDTYSFVVRTLTRREFENLESLDLPMVLLEDRVVEIGCLEHPETFRGEPWDWEKVPAGVVEQLAHRILQLSGFKGDPDPLVLEPATKYLQSEGAKYDLMILTVLPQYKLEDLLDMDVAIWHRIVGHSYSKMLLQGMDPDAILNPEKYAKKRQRMEAEARALAEAQQVIGMPGGGRASNNRVQYKAETAGAEWTA